MSEAFLGEIRMFGGNFAPFGWQFCNGQLLSISQNTALFSILGTTYGGDGVSTFALPNLQGRVPIHWGSGVGLSPYDLGQNGGSENVTLLQTQMPAHSHPLAANTGGAQLSPSNNFPGNEGAPIKIYATTSNATMNPAAVGNSGGSQPHDNIEPYLCVSFIIALQGIYPSRN